MRKTILFIGIIIFLIAAVVVVFGVFAKKDDTGKSLFDKVIPAPEKVDTGVRAPEAPFVRPEGEMIEIGTPKGAVRVKNFYPEKSDLDESGSIRIASGDGYFISYDTVASRFWIAVTGATFASVRSRAETDFVSRLGISQNDACNLDVSVGVPWSAANPLSGVDLPLSFCAVLVP